MAMHCTQKLAREKILGLHYRGFEILTAVFTRACELSPSKNWQPSGRVEKVRLTSIDKRCLFDGTEEAAVHSEILRPL